MKKTYRYLPAALLALAMPALHAENLATNGDFQTANEANDWPAHWGKVKSGGEWGKDGENRYLTLKSTGPGKMVMLYHEIKIPQGTKALRLSWKERVTGLKKGVNPWFDARIMLEFSDADRGKVADNPKSPKAPNAAKDTDGWVERETSFLVPEGAVYLKFMPALFQVEAGTFELDDIVIEPTDAAPLQAASDKARSESEAKKLAEASSRRAKATAAFEATGIIISNGDFETDSKGKGWPDSWGKPKDAVWGDEDGNRFLSIRALEPGKTALVHRVVDIPSGIEALELSFRQRITGLKKGKLPWHDARIMLELKDAIGKEIEKKPTPAYSQKDTDGWVEKSSRFLVPKEALSLVLMPALFEVNAGTFDLDDITLKPIDPEILYAAQREAEALAKARYVAPEEDKKDKWPAELKVSGNRLVDPDGKEVWLQGVNIPSLEWSLTGESVLKSTIVATEDWKSNVLRLPVKEEYWFGKGGQSDGGEAYRKLVDMVITLSANRGTYVVLDLHRYRAPREEHLEFWTDAATRYKNHPAVLFDLINEPHGISWETWRDGGFVEEAKKEGDEDAFLTAEEKAQNKRGFQSPGMQKMIETVRATGAKNIVVAGGLDWAYDLTGITEGFALEDKDGNGIMYASHVYPWKRGWQEKFLKAAALHPILLGETGAGAKKMDWMPPEQQEDAETWVPAMLGLIQQHRLNWTAWCFHPKASPRMLEGWDYTPTAAWGVPAKQALSGKQFPPPEKLR